MGFDHLGSGVDDLVQRFVIARRVGQPHEGRDVVTECLCRDGGDVSRQDAVIGQPTQAVGGRAGRHRDHTPELGDALPAVALKFRDDQAIGVIEDDLQFRRHAPKDTVDSLANPVQRHHLHVLNGPSMQ